MVLKVNNYKRKVKLVILNKFKKFLTWKLRVMIQMNLKLVERKRLKK